MSEKHTPLPWDVMTFEGKKVTVLLMSKSQVVADLDGCDNPKPDGDFIVRACNSHYDLLAERDALKAANEELRDACIWSLDALLGVKDKSADCHCAIVSLREITAKAKGTP